MDTSFIKPTQMCLVLVSVSLSSIYLSLRVETFFSRTENVCRCVRVRVTSNNQASFSNNLYSSVGYDSKYVLQLINQPKNSE